MQKMKIGPKALKTSLEYLISHGWIDNVGSRKVMTPGGPQDVQIYRVNDIWKMNADHYKGANESVPLPKGGDERSKGANERSKGGDESATTKNYIKLIDTSEAEAPRVEEIVVSFSEGDERVRKPAKYPNARTAFLWFPKPQKSWNVNTTELIHGEMLFERGEDQCKGALAFVAEYKDDPFCPTITKPSDLERKWLDLISYKRKNGL